MSVPKGEIVVQNFIEKNEQPRKNLDKLTIRFFLTEFYKLSDGKPCQSICCGSINNSVSLFHTQFVLDLFFFFK